MIGLKIDTIGPISLKEALQRFINNHLQSHITPKTTYKNTRKRIRNRNEEGKRDIMYRKYKLKKIVGQKIYIIDDLTKQERENTEPIRKFCKK